MDRVWHGVRIYRASGTHDPAAIAAIVRALDDLKRSHDVGLSTRLAVWGDLAAGRLHPLQFLEQVRRFGLTGLRPGPQATPLAEVLQRWIASGPTTRRGAPISGTTIAHYRLHIEHLLALQPGATMEDLPDLVRRIREEGTPGTAAVARTAAQTLARWLTGKHSDLSRAVANVDPPAQPDHDRVGLPPDECRRVALELGTEGGIWWTLYTTGMRVKIEYLSGAWQVHRRPAHIEILRSKTKAGVRRVPLLAEPVTAAVGYTLIADKLRALGLKAHIARYSYLHLLEESGIPPARRDLYMGHSLAGVRVYGRHDVAEYLERDAVTIAEVLGPPPRLLQAVAQ